MLRNMWLAGSQRSRTWSALGATALTAGALSLSAKLYAHMAETPTKSLCYMEDEPDEKTYGYSNLTVAQFPNQGVMTGLIFLYQAFPVGVLALVTKLLRKRSLGWISMPIWCYYLYDRGESWIEFDLLLIKLRLSEDDPSCAYVTKGLFYPREYKIKIEECRQTYRYSHVGHRMNYFQALTEKGDIISFVRFDYDLAESDPMMFSNKSLFCDVLMGRTDEVKKYEFVG